MDWDLVSFVTSSKVRFRILTTLNKSKNTPTGLSKQLSIHISAVSRALSELSKKDLITCLTSQRKKSKFFEITEDGKELLNKINKETRIN